MHALPLDKYLPLAGTKLIHNRPLFVAGIPTFRKGIVILYVGNKIVVRHRASRFAGSATDAPSRID